MGSSIETALRRLVQVVGLVQRPLPDPGSLGTYRPTLEGLERDDDRIILDSVKDGGDSANRTGVLSFCNSEIDRQNLGMFMVAPGMMTRHPKQADWNNPKNSSRDQLIAYVAGCWRSGRTDIANALLRAHAERIPPFTCQNVEEKEPGSIKNPPVGDLLSPADIAYLRICAGDTRAAVDLAAQLHLFIAIQTANPDEEINQQLLTAIVCGQLDVFVEAQSNYRANLDAYWVVRRHQKSIAVSLGEVVDIELGRYKTPDLLDYLLPANVLAELRNVDVGESLKRLAVGDPSLFTELSGRFLLATLRDIRDRIEFLNNSLATLDAVGQELALAAIKALRPLAIQACREVEDRFGQLGIPGARLATSMLRMAVSIVGFASLFSEGDDADAEIIRQMQRTLNQVLANTEEILQSIKDLDLKLTAQFQALSYQLRAEFYEAVLGELKGELANARILLQTFTDGVGEVDSDRVTEQVDRIRVLTFRIAEKYGAGTLAICFQAYGMVVALLSLIEGGADEIAATRNTFVGTIFKPHLFAPNGPLSQMMKLEDELKRTVAAFDGSTGLTCIGVRNDVVVRTVQPGWPLDEMKIPDGFRVSLYFCRIDGAVADASSVVAGDLDQVEYGKLPAAVEDVARVQELLNIMKAAGDRRGGARIAAKVAFVHSGYSAFNWPAKGTQEDISVKAKAEALGNARALCLRFGEAERILPEIQALATTLRATFSL